MSKHSDSVGGCLKNPRHERFCQEYLVDLNATKAYLRAGYRVKDSVARAAASRLLAGVNVSARVTELQRERAERTQITVDRVLEELAAVGFSNIQHYAIGEDGSVQPTPEAPESVMRAISFLKRKRRVIERKDADPIVETETEIRLWDKPAALRLAGQHLGLYTEKREYSGPGGGPIQTEDVNDARERFRSRIDAIASRLRTGDPGPHSN